MVTRGTCVVWRRQSQRVKLGETPDPKWDGGGCDGPPTGTECLLAARRKAGTYGLLEAPALELGNSHTAVPTSVGPENARVREGGRRRRSSRMPGCNGQDRGVGSPGEAD